LFAWATGLMAECLCWNGFFLRCTLIAIPGLLILLRFKNWNTANR